MPLIHTAYNLGFTPVHVEFDFHPRDGEAKLSFSTSWGNSKGAIKTKLLIHVSIHFAPESESTMIGSGFAYKRKRFTTHTSLPSSVSASYYNPVAAVVLLMLILATLAYGIATNWMQTSHHMYRGCSSSVYFLDVLF